jgi:hypothetical protein
VRRSDNVLERLLAEIDERLFHPVTYLLVGCSGQAHPARFANSFQSRGNTDPVAHQVAVALLDHVAKMYADHRFVR